MIEILEGIKKIDFLNLMKFDKDDLKKVFLFLLKIERVGVNKWFCRREGASEGGIAEIIRRNF